MGESENQRSNPGGSTLQSVDRAFWLLERVWQADGPCRLTDLAAETTVGRSSVCRMLKLLVRRGYLTQDPRSRMYQPGAKVLELARRFEHESILFRHARPHLVALSERTAETAHLGLRSGDGVLLADHVFSSQALGVTSAAGTIEPLTCTALGKALICEMSAEKLREEFGNPLPRYTPGTIVEPDELAGQLERVLSESVAMDYEEYREGICCLASPIRDRRGGIIAAIGISGPAGRLEGQRFELAADCVRAAAGDISAAMGNVG